MHELAHVVDYELSAMLISKLATRFAAKSAAKQQDSAERRKSPMALCTIGIMRMAQAELLHSE